MPKLLRAHSGLIATGRPFDGRQGGADRRHTAARQACRPGACAPAPPTPMPPPCSPPTAPARGVEQSLSVLAGGPLLPKLREQVIEDTLRGAPAAKRAWTER